MGLRIDDIGNGSNSNSIKLTDGVYAQKFTIIDANIKYNTAYFEDTRDILLELTINAGKDENWTIQLAGNYKRDDKGQITGWGTAFPIAKLLHTCGISAEVDDNGRFNMEDLRPIANQELYKITYVAGLKEDGKPKYKTWNTYFSPNATAEEMRNEFVDSLKKGYPKDYAPDVLEKDTAFSYGANAEKKEQEDW
jgi:hypothetical protein